MSEEEVEGGSLFNNTSSEDQLGGAGSFEFLITCTITLGCTICVLSVILILVIWNGNYCKNRGGLKNKKNIV
jgi:hypothetical protein